MFLEQSLNCSRTGWKRALEVFPHFVFIYQETTTVSPCFPDIVVLCLFLLFQLFHFVRFFVAFLKFAIPSDSQ